MAAMDCSGMITDAQGRETAPHGTDMFPIAFYEDDLKKFTVAWHWHEEFECIVATEGSVTVLLNGKRITLCSGEGLFVNSGILHGVEKGEEEASVLRSIVFHPRLIGGSPDSIFWQKLITPLLQDRDFTYLPLRLHTAWQAELNEELLRIWQVGVEEEEGYENWIRYRLSSAFMKLNNNRPEGKKKKRRQDDILSERMKSMMKFVEAHYTEELTVEQIAETVAVSPSACLRCFKQALDTTPVQYIKQLRIGKAAQLLLMTDRKIWEIGLACGFSDQSYFTKVFREEKGCTPKQYRDSYQN